MLIVALILIRYWDQGRHGELGNIVHTVGSNFLFQSEKDEAGGSLANVTSTASPSPSVNKSSVNGNGVHIAGNGQPESGDRCAGCSGLLRDGQALVALDKQYHIWCFKCTACQVSSDWSWSILSSHWSILRSCSTESTWGTRGGLTARGATTRSSESAVLTVIGQ